MIEPLLAPVTVATVLAFAVTTVHRRLPPAVAARFVTAALVLVVIAALPSLALLALTFLAHVPVLGTGVAWCTMALGVHHHHAAPAWVGFVALLVLAVGVGRAGRVVRDHRRLRCHHAGPVTLADDDRPFAVTLPGRGGRIVVSSGLVALLGADERAVVLAHERAHAHHRHDRYLYVAALSSALVPPVAALSARLRYAVERWADETAARACGDRRLVATTLGKVALHHAGEAPGPRLALPGFAGLGVPGRVRALLAPPVDRPGRPAVASLWVALVAVAAFSVYQLHHLEALVAALCPH